MTALSIFLALAAAFALAACFYPALALGPRGRVVCACVLGIGIALTPLLVPADSRFTRLVVACLAASYAMKLIDLHFGALRGRRVDFRSFLAFLANPLQLVQRRIGDELQPAANANRRDWLRSLAGLLLTIAVLRLTGLVDWSAWPFLLEHAVRASLVFLMVLFLFQQLAALARMTGAYVIDPEDRPFLARTPAQFWRRYNRWVSQFLQEDVFMPLGGRRHPVRGMMAVFALSGLGHEYVFYMATGRVQGYQMAFFLLQGVAVVATLRVKPKGRAALAWGAGTWTFNLLSSVLFFASVQGVWPIYPTGLPAWFPGW